jgi:HD-GYP domain-containing protein (c-di-GMP phosphodiesterase class II)
MTRPTTAPAAPAPGTGLKRRGRIVYSLLAVLVFVGLAPLGTVAWKLIDINREALKTSQQEYQLLLASSIGHEVDIHVEALRSQVVRVARTLGASIPHAGRIGASEVRTLLEGVVEHPLLHVRYSYFRAREVSSVSAGELPESLEPRFAAGLERATGALVGVAGEEGDPAVLSEPFVFDAEPARAMLLISVPVVSRGKFRGVLSALVDLQAVWESIVDRNRTGHLIYAVGPKGHVLASTDPQLVSPGRDMSASESVRRFLLAEGRRRETLPYSERHNGTEERYLGSYEITREGWGVFVRAREREVYLPVESMIGSTMRWAAAALVLAALAALFFARTLSEPIRRLAGASRAFAQGDFATRVTVGSRNEIGELAITFNRMASEIEDHILRLKQAARENNELFLGTIRALAQAIDAKDPYTKGHSVRVNRYSVIIARELALSEREIRDIHVSSLLHDVGKIGIDDSVLKKPGKLTRSEFEIIKKHPVLGANIMAEIPKMQRILPGLRWHHERWTGGGYPDGLVGEAIPLMARIIAVADTFDAITTHRPYQTAMTFDQAVRRIGELKGVALDGRVVEAFNRACMQKQIQLDPQEEPAAAPEAGAPHAGGEQCLGTAS